MKVLQMQSYMIYIRYSFLIAIQKKKNQVDFEVLIKVPECPAIHASLAKDDIFLGLYRVLSVHFVAKEQVGMKIC